MIIPLEYPRAWFLPTFLYHLQRLIILIQNNKIIIVNIISLISWGLICWNQRGTVMKIIIMKMIGWWRRKQIGFSVHNHLQKVIAVLFTWTDLLIVVLHVFTCCFFPDVLAFLRRIWLLLFFAWCLRSGGSVYLSSTVRGSTLELTGIANEKNLFVPARVEYWNCSLASRATQWWALLDW